MTKENFNLKKVKVEPKSVTVTYSETGKDEEITIEKKVAPHPDLNKSLSVLRDLMTEVFEMPEANVSRFEIRGLTVSEKKEQVQVLITSVFETGNGLKTCINSPNIPLEGESYELQEGLSDQYDTIVTEVYAFLFENKQAQASLTNELFPEKEEVTNEN